MKRKVKRATALAALTVAGLVSETVVSADSAETHCSAATSCSERPLATEPWSPDAPEHENAANFPVFAEIRATNSFTSGIVVSAPRRRLAIRRRPFFRQPRRLYPLYAMNSAPFEGEGLPPGVTLSI